MPELPDVTIYIEHLRSRIAGKELQRIRVVSPFVLRSVDPPLAIAEQKRVLAFRRIGKQIVWELEGGLFLVIHLMIAGRFHWKAPGAKAGGKINLAAFDFADGSLFLTEAGTKKRASMYLTRGEASLASFDRGGVDVLTASFGEFRDALHRENHTLKRALTDQRLFSGIGNAYSDEILHRARLSPLQLTRHLEDPESRRLFESTRAVMAEWTDRLRAQAGSSFPETVTAFRPEMAVHGKFKQPCPVCSTPVQRIVYAENECNYCPHCQTGGKLLADRSLSRLLKDDWPRTIEELEATTAARAS